MPSPDDSTPVGVENAFDPNLLARLAQQDEPLTAAEAAYGGGFLVRSVDGGYGLYAAWDDPERGDEPYAFFPERPLACLAAALLAAAAKSRTLWSQRSEDGHGRTVHRYGEIVGRLRLDDPDLVVLLNLGEALARSPVLVALLVEGLGHAAAEAAGKVLAHGSLSP